MKKNRLYIMEQMDKSRKTILHECPTPENLIKYAQEQGFPIEKIKKALAHERTEWIIRPTGERVAISFSYIQGDFRKQLSDILAEL